MSAPFLIQKRIYLVETHEGLREAWCAALEECVSFKLEFHAVGSVGALDRLFSSGTPDLLVLGCESAGFTREKVLELLAKCTELGVIVLLCSIDDEWSLLASRYARCAFVPKTVDPTGFLSAVQSSLTGLDTLCQDALI
jgi:DNA-binding NarL/FixJ family response regulator